MKRVLIFSFLILMGSQILAAEDIDYDSYYRSPFSFGVNYLSLSPLSDFDSGTPYNIFDLAVSGCYSPAAIPWLQPQIIGGMTKFDSQDSADPLTWDSTNYYGMAGLRINHKLSKSFEFGFDLTGGIGQGVFNDLTDDTAGTLYALGQAGIRLGLSPTYNMTLELSPVVRYQHSLDSVFTDMNGFLMGIGGAISFRFGKDPDSPDAASESLRFKDPQIEPLFASMQSYYRSHPIGKVTIENKDRILLKDISVFFNQSGYMDAPTLVCEIEELKKGETIEIPLTASFNKEIFLTEGITPLSGEVQLSYSRGGRSVRQSYPVSYDLYDKTSLVWNDDRKAAAFITPADSALQNYTSFIRKNCKEALVDGCNDRLQAAIQIFQALNELGLIYQADPQQPFAAVSDSQNLLVDSVSLPRNTLRKLTGDCDDLTVLYLSLLETVGIETAFITVPGHIYTAFNTKEESHSYGGIHPDRSMTINIDGEVWVPVEITLLGKKNFLDAWRTGAEQWNALEETPEKRNIHITAEARETYRPIGLTETDLGLQYGNGEYIRRAFAAQMESLSDLILAEYYRKVDERENKQNYNRLGIALTRLGRRDKALRAFQSSIKMDPDFLSPRVNLSNIAYLNENYREAASQLEEVLSILKKKGKDNGRIAFAANLNLSKIYYAMEQYKQAGDFYHSAETIDPEQTREYSYLASVSSNDGVSRAAEIGNDQILFLDEQE